MNVGRPEIDHFYDLLDQLVDRAGGPFHLVDPGLSRTCPTAGLYFFFEDGEQRPNGRPRVVRIGTHGLRPGSTATLWNRLRQHRGRLRGSNPGGGNHRGSIFRRHVGAALLRRDGDTEVLRSWMSDTAEPGLKALENAVEVRVSEVIRAMPFVWLSVPTRPNGTSERGVLERNLIALLAGGAEPASPSWLGQFAASGKVRASGLWNVNHVNDSWDVSVLDLLATYVRCTT
jgi:hypothetical protein